MSSESLTSSESGLEIDHLVEEADREEIEDDEFENKDDKNNGRWTKSEHENFLKGMEQFGREWKKVQILVESRTTSQIRSHAQKYFQKLKESKLLEKKSSVLNSSVEDNAFSVLELIESTIKSLKRKREQIVLNGSKSEEVQDLVKKDNNNLINQSNESKDQNNESLLDEEREALKFLFSSKISSAVEKELIDSDI